MFHYETVLALGIGCLKFFYAALEKVDGDGERTKGSRDKAVVKRSDSIEAELLKSALISNRTVCIIEFPDTTRLVFK